MFYSYLTTKLASLPNIIAFCYTTINSNSNNKYLKEPQITSYSHPADT